MMLLLGMNLQLKNELKNSIEKIETLEKSVQQKDEQIKELEHFAVGIATVQNRLIKDTLKEPEPDLLEANKWEKDEDKLKWSKFVNQRLEEKLNGSEFDKLLSRNILGFEEAWPVFNYTLKRMVPNRYYYGSTDEFYKVNVASYIDSLQVIYIGRKIQRWVYDRLNI